MLMNHSIQRTYGKRVRLMLGAMAVLGTVVCAPAWGVDSAHARKVAGASAARAGVPAPGPAAQSNNPNITVGEWGARWWQWLFSLKVHDAEGNEIHPILAAGAVDCSMGQTGDVWFLAGTFGSDPVTRTCAVRKNTTLFFPVINGWADNVAELVPGTIPELQAKAANFANADVSQLHVYVDGEPLPITEANRGAAVFQYAVPNEDNLLNWFGAVVPGPDWPYGKLPKMTVVYPAASDGYWMMLRPLDSGTHNIHFFGTSQSGFAVDITYVITVR